MGHTSVVPYVAEISIKIKGALGKSGDSNVGIKTKVSRDNSSQ